MKKKTFKCKCGTKYRERYPLICDKCGKNNAQELQDFLS